MKETKRTALVISYGPVPTPQYQKIEGGGMRAWGIATGLSAHGIDVTVAINEGFPQDHSAVSGIHLTTWTLNEEFKSFINTFDFVVVSYCMGDASVFIADHINDNVTLVLDAYVPIYVEVSARDSEDKQTELQNYEKDIVHFNHVLLRGDYFLCANTPQKHMYTGILASLNVINPVTYRDDRVLVVPFGIESEALKPLTKSANPYLKLGIQEDDFVLLWFGGLYPWFNFQPLISSIIKLAKNPRFKFVLVGGKNPYNNHPDFVKQYVFVKDAFEKNGLLGKSVFLVDWVDYNERLLWYQGARAVISINQPGEENVYSWRTRVMDYVWGSIPMLTNGGDPLSDQLLAVGAALPIETNETSITDTVESLIAKPTLLNKTQAALATIRESYYWEKVVQPIIDRTEKDALPYAEFKAKRLSWGFNATSADLKPIARIRNKASNYYTKARQKGFKKTTRYALSFGKSAVKAKLRAPKATPAQPKAILLSHPIDETGAPLVLLDIAKDFAKHFAPKDVHIVSPDIKPYILKDLVKRGFTIHKMVPAIGARFAQAQLNIQPDDFVLINTVAVFDNYRSLVYWLLESGRLKQAHWFIHEDSPKLRFQEKGEIERVKRLIHKGLLRVYVPSAQTAGDYNAFFETDAFQPVTLRVSVPKALSEHRPATDFQSINFVTSGSPWDGRKGQFLLLNALLYFEQNLKESGVKYRNYTVNLLAMSDDYISKQLISTGEAFFGERFKAYKKMPREEALKITHECNVTVCSSLNETFALFVAEGMALGHPIVRNKASGWQEQMKDGVNGFIFDDLSLVSLAEKLEAILNPDKLSNEQLAEMGNQSQLIAQKFAEADYFTQLGQSD